MNLSQRCPSCNQEVSHTHTRISLIVPICIYTTLINLFILQFLHIYFINVHLTIQICVDPIYRIVAAGDGL